MCGLTGMAGDIQKEDRVFLKNLLLVSILRGMDSTGIASITDKGVVNVFKRAMPANDFILDRRYESSIPWDTQVILGHTRAATIGAINNHTAHPFDTGSVVGAHNGTLTGWHKLPDSKNYTVDSECLINAINEHGWDDVMPLVGGAWALTLYNPIDHKLEILRNDERSLYIGYKDNGSVMYWASELWMLKSLAERCGIKLGKRFFQPKPHVLHTWELPDKKFTEKFPEATSRRIAMPEEKKIIPVQTYNQRPSWNASQEYDGAGNGRSGGFSYTNRRENRGNVQVIRRDEHSGANLIGSFISFTAVEKKTSPSGQLYLEGVSNVTPFDTVRCYVHPNDIDKYLDSDEPIRGKVSAFYMGRKEIKDDGPYLVLAPNTLSAPGVKVAEVAFGPHGSLIGVKRFSELTKDGCGNCGEPLDINSEIKWYGDSPVCENCTDIVNQYGKGEKSC